ncbi:MAG: hypothetical protein N4A48_05655 [Tepidibacter sp.]|jgi:hypothetical protein|uniref:hypothetical protein n=1 Tax=Tepidibacter sp. TaxID=2529387 RepID=UPI0025F1AF1A|nr:hypothetical protein [Tepidibacter sp.]MCT4508239.1 hypothetical protein [Tepidibacter sp.]
MNDARPVITKVRNYLESIGVPKKVLDYELSNIKAVLVLNLPSVCILKENRPTSSKQTHIHVTGDGMGFFYDRMTLHKNPELFANDSREDVILFKKNLIDLEEIAVQKNGMERNLQILDKDDILESYTVKKVGRIGTPGIQVQISKKRLDDRWFMHLRKCLFTNDVLVFIKTEKRDADIVVGIPHSYIESDSIRNMTIFAEPESEEQSLGAVSNNSEIESNINNPRSVNYGSIARFAPNDEQDENSSSITDLTASIKTRKKRTQRHQDIVKLIALDLEREGYSLYENPMDCLAIKDKEPALLFEIKTLDGSTSDEKKQVQKAFSQLFYYEEFNTREYNKNGIKKIAVFESRISEEHIIFFEKNNIKVAWINEKMHLVDTKGLVKFSS